MTPPADTPLGEFTGSIWLSGDNIGMALPFRALVTSSATGDLVVFTENELTYYAEGALRIPSAYLSLRDFFSGDLVAEAVANSDGFAVFAGITEGYWPAKSSLPELKRKRVSLPYPVDL